MIRKKKAGESKVETQQRLNDMIGRLDGRCKTIEGRIEECNKRLLVQKKEMKRAAASKSAAKKKVILKSRKQAQRILQQRKVFENQLDQLRNQEANVHNQMFQLENLEFAVEQAKAMKQTKKAMQRMKLDIDEVADLKDAEIEQGEDLAELQNILGEPMAGMDYDDAELELELDMMDDDFISDEVQVSTKTKNKKQVIDDFDELEAELGLLDDLPEIPVANKTRKNNERRAVNL